MNEDGNDTPRPLGKYPSFDGSGRDRSPASEHPAPSPRPADQLPWLPSAAARRRRAALLLCGFLSAVVLLVSGSSWAVTGWLSDQLHRYDVFTGLLDENRPPASQGALNFLVIGSDDRSGLDSRQRSELGWATSKGGARTP